MYGRMLKTMSLIMALFLVSTAAGCKSGGGDEYSSYLIVEEVEDGSDNSGTGTDASDVSGQSQSSVSDNSTSNTATSNPGQSAKVDPSKYRGTTVVYATWKDPNANEDGPVVKAFEKKYGIKVKIDFIPQLKYLNEITARIQSGKSPDIFFETSFFPSALAVLQPIDAMQLDLKDPIWEKGMLEFSKINGKSYLINTVGNIWSEVACLYYNKRIFEDNNIKTPDEYIKEGNWTYETLTKCMTEAKNAGFQSSIDAQIMLAAADAYFYKYSNGKFTNGVNETTTKIMTQISQWYKDGITTKARENPDNIPFNNGKLAVVTTDLFGLKKTGYFSSMKATDIGFTTLPSFEGKAAVPCGISRGYGLVKGAKNPVGAGIFLRYYCDSNNYNLTSTFVSPEAQKFFFQQTAGTDSAKKIPYLLNGIVPLTGEGMKDYIDIFNQDPRQVSKSLDQIKNKIDSNVIVLNKKIKNDAK